MSSGEIAFWIAFMVLAFIGFLGLQMRYFAGVALKIYVGNRLKQASKGDVQAIILNAVGGRRAPAVELVAQAAEVKHLREEHTRPLQYIRIGRTISLVVPFMLGLMLVAWRFWPF
ncbi:MAG: hypothetical protein AAFQ22_08700 [Pseudomonadota bacterium]